MPSDNSTAPTSLQQGQKRKSDKSDGKDPFSFNEPGSSDSDSSSNKRIKSEFSFLRHRGTMILFKSHKNTYSYI